jgi:uncharacterized protein YegL
MKINANNHGNQRCQPQTNLTELVFILDRSGSMGGLESDTLGGFNSMLAKQQATPGECRITTVLFDNEYEVLHDRLDLNAVRPITEREYFVRGNTALLDAVGKTINKIDNAQRQSKPGYRAEKVLFVITTDGMENASYEYTYSTVKAQIEQRKSKYGWEFIFLGANIDAVETAGRFGIAADRAQNYHADSVGTQVIHNVMSETIAEFRAKAAIPQKWSEKIEVDYKKRVGK